MIIQCYEDLYKQVEMCASTLTKMVDIMLTNQQRNDFVKNLQSAFVGIAEDLEKTYKLHDKPIIALLKRCAELSYIYLCDRDESVLVECREFIRDLPKTLEESVDLNDVELAAVVIIRNNGEYMREWIEYHRMVGVKHFYIYDNESVDGLKDILSDYIEHNIVTYKYWPGPVMQLPAYNDAVDNYKYDAKYMAFIDGDEFLMPVMKHGDRMMLLPEVIEYILDKHEKDEFKLDGNCGGIGVVWRTYGTSFHKNRQNGLLIENYNYRAEDTAPFCIHIKSICNPRVITGFLNPHAPVYAQGYYCISEKGSYIPSAYFYDSKCELLRINHYRSKSEEELLEKLERGTPDRVYKEPDEMAIAKSLHIATVEHNKVYDPIMEPYVDELKKRLANPDYTI
ncbi:MAG: hypothetical protein E7261_03315 [Lachnospiraceae bacterium]|nr:hypothetical protein [Lachnospiraceae bacterium]